MAGYVFTEVTILWCITGAGHQLEGTMNVLSEIIQEREADVLMSNAGEEVLKAYGLFERVCGLTGKTFLESEQGACTPLSGSARYNAVIVAPASANTCAKLAGGIADSAVTNVVSQYLKKGIPAVILPTDIEAEVETTIPNGKNIIIHPRRIDLDNAEKLQGEANISVVKKACEIKDRLP